MFVRIREDLQDMTFSTDSGILIENDSVYPARYVDDKFQIFINDTYMNIEGIDFDILENHKIDVLSPDGFGIHPTNLYDTPEEANKALDEWVLRYKLQGYYSSNEGRISLENLKDCCEMIIVEVDTNEN